MKTLSVGLRLLKLLRLNLELVPHGFIRGGGLFLGVRVSYPMQTVNDDLSETWDMFIVGVGFMVVSVNLWVSVNHRQLKHEE